MSRLRPLFPSAKGRPLGALVATTLVLSALLLAWRGGWLRPQAKTAAGTYAGANLLLITIDTLRADHLPTYGYTGVKTPHIDALARESFVFRNAISHIPLTLPSHTSMLTSLLPPSHSIPDNGTFVLDPRITTLPEILKGKGYATAAFVSTFILDSRWQLNKGFDVYYDDFFGPQGDASRTRKRGDETLAQAETWLAEHKGGPLFAWVHFYDPHQTYDPPEPYRSQYPRAPYDAEIAYTDQNVGRLLRTLDELGLGERTIVCLTADHGENLGDHGELTHGLLIYESTQHVPLMIRLPKGSHREVTPAVGHVDMAPTFLAWLGIPVPAQMQGRSLIGTLEGTEADTPGVYSESRLGALHYGWSPLSSLTTTRYKYIKAPRPELYDRLADPGEMRNLIGEKPSVAAGLASRLDAVVRSATPAATTTVTIDTDTEERLAALGYLGGGIESAPVAGDVDPKDRVRLHDIVAETQGALVHGEPERAVEMGTKLLAEAPDMVDVRRVVGEALVRLARYDEALRQFEIVVKAHPDNPKALLSLGTTLQGLHRYAEAEPVLLKLAAIDRKRLGVLIHLGHLYRRTGRPEKGRQYFLEAAKQYAEMAANPAYLRRKPELLSRLAEAHFRGGELDRAEQDLRAAIDLRPKSPAFHYNLALVYQAKRDTAAAIAAYTTEVELAPQNFRAFRELGVLLRGAGRVDEAVVALKKALAIQPKDAESCYRLAETYYMANRNLPDARRLAREAIAIAPTLGEARRLLSQIERRLAG